MSLADSDSTVESNEWYALDMISWREKGSLPASLKAQEGREKSQKTSVS